MIRIILLSLCTTILYLLPTALSAQTTVFVSERASDPDLTLKISEKVSFPDIKVEIGRRISFENITVGMTKNRNKADYIIADSQLRASKSVRLDSRTAFPDLTILYGNDISFPDVRIEVHDDEYFRADVLIYTEKATISEQEIIGCLIDLIKKKAD